ncbi:MAG: hypothetical protein MH252_14065 [Thermosynechococcaceae cyanobacterium MS004]|nr:hypothetical protein [Thermosynechococcaceae cyanobacterium MS004]
MKTTPTSFSTEPALTDEGVLGSALDCLQNHVSIDMQGTCSLKTLFMVLLRAASRADSIEHTAQRLTGVPTGNALRYHLDKLNDTDSHDDEKSSFAAFVYGIRLYSGQYLDFPALD